MINDPLPTVTELKNIHNPLDDEPFTTNFTDKRTDFTEWDAITDTIADHLDALREISNYYQKPLPHTLNTILHLGIDTELTTRQLTQGSRH